MGKTFLVFLTVVLAVVVAFQLREDHITSYEETIAKYSTAHSNHLDWRGIKWHYIDQGEGMPVMLLHGYAGSFSNLERLVEVFPEGYRLIIPDLPGLGLSQFPEISEDDDISYTDLYCDFTGHVIDELGLDSLYLVGNSLGGYLSWETTLRNQDKVKKLVLLNAAGYSVRDYGSFFIKFSQTNLFKSIAKKGVPFFVAKKAAKRCLGDPSRIDEDRVKAFYGLINKEGNLDVILQLGNSNEVPDSSRISGVKSPTLIVWGDKDGIVPVEHAYKFNRDIEDSELIIYEGSGHVPMIENPDRLIVDIINFFETPMTAQVEL